VSASIASEQLFESLDDRTVDILKRRSAGKGRGRGWLVRRALLVADLAGLVAAFLVAQEIYQSQAQANGTLSRVSEFVIFALSLPLWVVVAKLYGLYDRDEERTDHSTTDDVSGVFHLVTVCTFLLYAMSHFTRWFSPEFTKLFVFWLLAIIGTIAFRGVARVVCRRQIQYLQNTIIVGAGEVGQALARKLQNHPEYGLHLVGFVDPAPRQRPDDLEHVAVLGQASDLVALVDLLDIERVIFAFSSDPHQESVRAIDDLRRQTDVLVDVVPRLFDGLAPSLSIHTVEGVPMLGLPPLRLRRSALLLKRATDIVVVACAAVVLLPLSVLVAVVVFVTSGRPILYRSRRIGRDGVRFEALKFRSMHPEGSGGTRGLAEVLVDSARLAEFRRTHKLDDDPRVTRLGRLLRRTSLDELPQLWNILRGDISVVGPRPITTDELRVMSADEREAAYWSISNLRPGLTGYWQINGRSSLDYADRLRLDRAYCSGWSMGLDLAIIAKTFRVLVARRGAV
jgi:exopolysaccharide biosynthesis polyprenyl glycosylphosphotransferase